MDEEVLGARTSRGPRAVSMNRDTPWARTPRGARGGPGVTTLATARRSSRPRLQPVHDARLDHVAEHGEEPVRGLPV
jgi:hypothetical protein